MTSKRKVKLAIIWAAMAIYPKLKCRIIQNE